MCMSVIHGKWLCLVIPSVWSQSVSVLSAQINLCRWKCSLLERCDTASASLRYMEEIIKLKRSIKMSGFYQVRWEEEWLCGLRGQVNYSEVYCLGLLVQYSGINMLLCHCVINADHFSVPVLLMFIISGGKSLSRWLACFHIFCIFTPGESLSHKSYSSLAVRPTEGTVNHLPTGTLNTVSTLPICLFSPVFGWLEVDSVVRWPYYDGQVPHVTCTNWCKRNQQALILHQ